MLISERIRITNLSDLVGRSSSSGSRVLFELQRHNKKQSPITGKIKIRLVESCAANHNIDARK